MFLLLSRLPASERFRKLAATPFASGILRKVAQISFCCQFRNAPASKGFPVVEKGDGAVESVKHILPTVGVAALVEVETSLPFDELELLPVHPYVLVGKERFRRIGAPHNPQAD